MKPTANWEHNQGYAVTVDVPDTRGLRYKVRASMPPFRKRMDLVERCWRGPFAYSGVQCDKIPAR